MMERRELVERADAQWARKGKERKGKEEG